jgi:hypothetical protein
MHETDPNLSLPDQAIVFLSHQGSSFACLLGGDNLDSLVFGYAEQRPAAPPTDEPEAVVAVLAVA